MSAALGTARPDDALAPPVPDAPAGPPPRRRRRAAWIVLALLVVAAAVATLLVVPRLRAAPAAAPDKAAPVATEPVTTGDMIAATNVKGTLRYAGGASLTAGPSGVLTEVPAAGAVITPGNALYRVNTYPVVLLRGDEPAWRTFEAGMFDSGDVRQLEQNLADFGLFSGTVDTKFTPATTTAIKAWQKVLGMEQSGKVDPAFVHFSGSDVRVSQSVAVLGADVAAGTEVYKTSSTDKVVDVEMRLADQQLAAVGAAVAVALPDGTETPGKVTAVGQPVEKSADEPGAPPGSGKSSIVVPASITLDDPAAAQAFPQAGVTARFSTTLSEGVLTVPVEALVAIDADTFAVELPERDAEGALKRVPVELGAFSSGRVAVTGPGIEDGTDVVVPQL